MKKHLVDDVYESLPEFREHSPFDRDELIDLSTFTLSEIGIWLNDLTSTKEKIDKNRSLIIRICSFINKIEKNPQAYHEDVENDICISFFWVIEDKTINIIKPYLSDSVLETGRNYLATLEYLCKKEVKKSRGWYHITRRGNASTFSLLKSNVEKMEKKKDVMGLVRALKHKESHVRYGATVALGRIGKPAVESLIQALRDKNPRIRLGAAVALGRIGDIRAVDPLTQALKDENSSVRQAVKKALDKLGVQARAL